METIVGKSYRVLDNSYSYCKTNPEKEALLAGYTKHDGTDVPGVIATIVCDPYYETVKFMGEEITEEFIDVYYQGHYYRVVYYPLCVTNVKFYSQENVILMLIEVLNLGMELRQDQLNGNSNLSGQEVLQQWMDKNL